MQRSGKGCAAAYPTYLQALGLATSKSEAFIGSEKARAVASSSGMVRYFDVHLSIVRLPGMF